MTANRAALLLVLLLPGCTETHRGRFDPAPIATGAALRYRTDDLRRGETALPAAFRDLQYGHAERAVWSLEGIARELGAVGAERGPDAARIVSDCGRVRAAAARLERTSTIGCERDCARMATAICLEMEADLDGALAIYDAPQRDEMPGANRDSTMTFHIALGKYRVLRLRGDKDRAAASLQEAIAVAKSPDVLGKVDMPQLESYREELNPRAAESRPAVGGRK